jgi:hypothetical protein
MGIAKPNSAGSRWYQLPLTAESALPCPAGASEHASDRSLSKLNQPGDGPSCVSKGALGFVFLVKLVHGQSDELRIIEAKAGA